MTKISRRYRRIANGKEAIYETISWLDSRYSANRHMISGLMEERGLSMKDAFDAVYTSRLFEKLSNPKTGLYFQSSGYVYSIWIEEIG